MKKNEILKLLYLTKDYPRLKRICNRHEESWYKNILAKVFFFEEDYKSAARIYYLQKMFYESGYCLLMQGDLYNAKRLWNSLDDEAPIVEWGKILLKLIEKKQTQPPTYFQVRNFLEQDLDALLRANLISYAENLINSVDILVQANSESYKYMARVLYNHNYLDIAKNFLNRSKDIYYKDPETHFLIGKINLAKGDTIGARVALNRAVEVNQDYFPAKNLLEKIK
ncbi:MAG: hypothetical protein PHV37_00925 [Candidatus Gastranaerophilales bacterium]|nr:hypothetical protein [Candidatus Gastranaerophilales bacterium]